MSCPVAKETANGLVGIFVTAQQQYLAAHLPYRECALEGGEEVLQVVASEEFKQATAVVARVVVAVGSMQEVYDHELRRVLPELVSQEIEGVVESELGGHDAVVNVDVAVCYGWAEVEGAYAKFPLLFEALVLCSGKFVAEGTIDGCRDAWESVPCARVVGAGNGERGNIGVIGQTLHPVLCL